MNSENPHISKPRRQHQKMMFRLEEETVGLRKNQMATLFGNSRSTITGAYSKRGFRKRIGMQKQLSPEIPNK